MNRTISKLTRRITASALAVILALQMFVPINVFGFNTNNGNNFAMEILLNGSPITDGMTINEDDVLEAVFTLDAQSGDVLGENIQLPSPLIPLAAGQVAVSVLDENGDEVDAILAQVDANGNISLNLTLPQPQELVVNPPVAEYTTEGQPIEEAPYAGDEADQGYLAPPAPEAPANEEEQVQAPAEEVTTAPAEEVTANEEEQTEAPPAEAATTAPSEEAPLAQEPSEEVTTAATTTYAPPQTTTAATTTPQSITQNYTVKFTVPVILDIAQLNAPVNDISVLTLNGVTINVQRASTAVLSFESYISNARLLRANLTDVGTPAVPVAELLSIRYYFEGTRDLWGYTLSIPLPTGLAFTATTIASFGEHGIQLRASNVGNRVYATVNFVDGELLITFDGDLYGPPNFWTVNEGHFDLVGLTFDPTPVSPAPGVSIVQHPVAVSTFDWTVNVNVTPLPPVVEWVNPTVTTTFITPHIDHTVHNWRAVYNPGQNVGQLAANEVRTITINLNQNGAAANTARTRLYPDPTPNSTVWRMFRTVEGAQIPLLPHEYSIDLVNNLINVYITTPEQNTLITVYYRTRLTDDFIAELSNSQSHTSRVPQNSVVVRGNEYSGTANLRSANGIRHSANATTIPANHFRWIAKTQVFVPGTNQREVEWTITINTRNVRMRNLQMFDLFNTDYQTLIPGSVRVNGTTVTPTAPATDHTGTAATFSVLLFGEEVGGSRVEQFYTITYRTLINEDVFNGVIEGTIDLRNSAWVTFERWNPGGGGGWHPPQVDTPVIVAPAPTRNSVTVTGTYAVNNTGANAGHARTFLWTVTNNVTNLNVSAGGTMTLTIGANQVFVPNSLQAAGGLITNYVVSGNTITVTLGAHSGPVTLTYRTLATNAAAFAGQQGAMAHTTNARFEGEFVNNAGQPTTFESNLAEGSANSANINILTASSGTALQMLADNFRGLTHFLNDEGNLQIRWNLSVNQTALGMTYYSTNAFITISIPAGTSFVPDSARIITADGQQVGELLNAVVQPNGTIRIDLPDNAGAAAQIIVAYETIADRTHPSIRAALGSTGDLTLTNHATFTHTVLPRSVAGRLPNPLTVTNGTGLVTPIVPQGIIIPNTGVDASLSLVITAQNDIAQQVAWQASINPYGATMNSTTITNILPENFSLVNGSVMLYEYELVVPSPHANRVSGIGENARYIWVRLGSVNVEVVPVLDGQGNQIGFTIELPNASGTFRLEYNTTFVRPLGTGNVVRTNTIYVGEVNTAVPNPIDLLGGTRVNTNVTIPTVGAGGGQATSDAVIVLVNLSQHLNPVNGLAGAVFTLSQMAPAPGGALQPNNLTATTDALGYATFEGVWPDTQITITQTGNPTTNAPFYRLETFAVADTGDEVTEISTSGSSVVISLARRAAAPFTYFVYVTNVFEGLFNVTFNYNFTGAPANVVVADIMYNTTINATTGANMPTTDVRTGWTFVSWNTQADGSGTAFDGGTVVTGNVTIYAQWTQVFHTVTFNAADATEAGFPTERVVAHGDTINETVDVYMPADPVRFGWEFLHWNTLQNPTNENQGNAFTSLTYVVGDMDVFAQWAQIIRTVTFDHNIPAGFGTSVTEDINVAHGGVIAMPFDPVLTGWTFDGWNTQADGNGDPFTGGVITSNMTVFAQWTRIYHTVTFNTNIPAGFGTPEITSTQVAHGVTHTIIGTPALTGWTFAGWNTQADGNGTQFVGGDLGAIIAPITVYIQWERIYLTVNFNNNSPISVPTVTPVSVAHGTAIVMPSNPMLAGWAFTGWNTQANGSGAAFTGGIITNNMTVFAQWTQTGGGGGTTPPVTTQPTTPPTTDTTTPPTTTLPTTPPTDTTTPPTTDITTPPTTDTTTPSDDNEFIDLDDTDTPLGQFPGAGAGNDVISDNNDDDDNEIMDLDDTDTPLGQFTPSETTDESSMPRTGVAAIGVHIYLLLGAALVTAISVALMIKRAIPKVTMK